MTATGVGTHGLRAARIAATLALLSACSAAPAARPTPTPAPDPAIEEIRAARVALGPTAIDLAEAVLALADGVDMVRHELPRGQEMADAVPSIDRRVAAVRAAADAMDRGLTVVSGAESEAVADARAAVAVATEEARDAAAAAEAERTALAALADIDVRLDAAAAAWNDPGSQSERRAELVGIADQLTTIGAEVAALEAEPPACADPWANRTEWAGLLAERSLQLAALATGSSGEEYDRLRREFSQAPYGEQREDADASSRPCWSRSSAVARAAAAAEGHVAALEAALNG